MTNMVLNTDKGITTKKGVGRVIEMSKALPYHPCLKHKEGSPKAMLATHVNYLGIELCTIVLNAINVHLSRVFCVSCLDPEQVSN